MQLKNRLYKALTNWKTIAIFLIISLITIFLISPITQTRLGGGSRGIPFVYYEYMVVATGNSGAFYPIFLVFDLLIYYAIAFMLAILLNFGKKQN